MTMKHVAFRPLLFLGLMLIMPNLASAQVRTGAEIFVDALARGEFPQFRHKRIGLITNHTAQVNGKHLIDLLYASPDVTLTTLFGPEHGLRGLADAGAKVADGRDPQTDLPVYSLYGANRKPTAEMLQNVEVLVFDIQDVGARFYTYISTMALAMQTAAEFKLPFVVLDRPNPVGGVQVAGFMLDPAYQSFVGQFAIPIQHGMTVGELAHMIRDERLMPRVESLDLTVVTMDGWRRDMLWNETGLPWIKTSPNIPDLETALVYPGLCLVEGTAMSEGRGTYAPFKTIGAPWANGAALANTLNNRRLPGVRFEATRFTPQSISGMSDRPKLQGKPLQGVRLVITNPKAFRAVETGIHVLQAFYRQAPAAQKAAFLNKDWLAKLSGTSRLAAQLTQGATPEQIIASWQAELNIFLQIRARHLLYL